MLSYRIMNIYHVCRLLQHKRSRVRVHMTNQIGESSAYYICTHRTPGYVAYESVIISHSEIVSSFPVKCLMHRL